MADKAGPSVAKIRVPRSAVHTYFDKVDVEHPKTKKIVDGSSCSLCKEAFLSRSSTNLKNHLMHKHPDAYNLVLHKYLSLFCVNVMTLILFIGADNDKSEVLVVKKPVQGTSPSDALFQKLHQVPEPPRKRQKGGSNSKEEKEYQDLRYSYFVGSGTVPLCISEDPNFKSFIKALNPEVRIDISLLFTE